ncbi:MAG: lysine--tRNA ligase [archaeon]
MGREQQIINERIRKLEDLRKKGINPYPSKFDKKNTCQQALKSKVGTKVKAAGRVMSKRDIGKIIFTNLRDESGDIQIVFQDGKTKDNIKSFFKKYIDIGDFIGVEGKIFKTKTKQISILVDKIELLSKAILPLPEKFHGLQDKEERYRKRYLDLIMNPEIREIFIKRSEIIKVLRNFFEQRGFIEVDTPILQAIPGGALAKPFITKYKAYNTDVYLRIAPELYLKRLLVGGFEKVFEFSRCFRNEGVDWSHNPEFTNMEFYQAYINYEDLMKITEDFVIEVLKKVNKKPVIERNDKKISVKKPFKRISFKEITKGKMTDEAFKEAIKKIKEPTFVTDHPLELSPLSKKKDEKTVQRFQLIIDGIEIVNAFSELNDPLDQEGRFKEQSKKKDEEKHEHDEDFIEALKYGMPPTGGLGLGVDRFVMLITGKNSLREILLFPFMKPGK